PRRCRGAVRAGGHRQRRVGCGAGDGRPRADGREGGPGVSTDQQRQRPGVIGRVVTWLRAGYPEGVPTGDYVALLGVLRRRLREEEIQEIVERLAAQRELDLTPD